MQGSSRTQFSQHQTARNNLQSQILASQRYKEQLSYSFDAQATPIPQSVPFQHRYQLQRQDFARLRRQRAIRLSHMLYAQKEGRNKAKQQTNQQRDSSLNYIAQIDALGKKKKARIYFLQKRENLQQSFKIGLLTKSGIQYEDSKDKQTQKTHSTSMLNASQQVTQESNVQEMHYKMVKIQQKHKQMTEK